MSTTATYGVRGMTCDHCVAAVRSELGALSGVRDVVVDLGNGSVTVTSDGPLDLEIVRLAVDEAGYDLEPPART